LALKWVDEVAERQKTLVAHAIILSASLEKPMTMSSLEVLFPEMARKETRTVQVLRPGNFNLPVDDYGFLELYCDEKDCDCRRVMISVFGVNQGKFLASIALGFDSGEVGAGPFLDPLGSQSIHSQDLLQLFTNVINDDPDYLARLQRHYMQYKEKIDGRPYNGRPFEDPDSVKRTPSDLEDAFAGRLLRSLPEPARWQGRKVGRNDPCPCGSGKKYKKCCLSKPKEAPGIRPSPGTGEIGGLREAKDLVDRVVRARKRDQNGSIDTSVQKALENRPALAFRFLGMLLHAYAPDGREWEPGPGYYACLDLLEENLTLVRYSVERKRAWAIDLSRRIQAEIARQAFTPEVDVRVQNDLLVALRESRLELEPAIRKQSAKVGE